MPRHYVCDHCGRSGAVLGVIYPGGDITQPAIRLCQTYNGEPVSPNCYHLVKEMGEPLGARRETPILETDRQAPIVEGAQIRFDQHVTAGTIVTERKIDPETGEEIDTGQANGVPVTGEGEVTQERHPLDGQSLDTEPRPQEVDPAITEAEKGKGIINPHGADQRPLIDPASPEGQAIADAAAEEAARRIPAPVGMSPRTNPENQTVAFPRPPESQFVDPSDTISGQAAVLDAERAVAPQADEPAEEQPKRKTPAEIAAEAQAKADEEEAAARLDRNPEVKERLEATTEADLDKAVEVQLEEPKAEPKKAPAKKAPAKKVAAKPAEKAAE